VAFIEYGCRGSMRRIVRANVPGSFLHARSARAAKCAIVHDDPAASGNNGKEAGSAPAAFSAR
jgi:hypothetical protein